MDRKESSQISGGASLPFLFQHLGYHGPLISDLERYLLAGDLRAEWIRNRDEYSEQMPWREQEKSATIRVGFLGILEGKQIFKEIFLQANVIMLKSFYMM